MFILLFTKLKVQCANGPNHLHTESVLNDACFGYLNTSNVTCCFAIASTVFSYMWTLCIPMPQKMANASTKFSSFLVNGKLSNLLTNWNTPKTLFGLLEYMMGMHKMVLCLKSLSLSTSGSNLKSETQIGSFHVRTACCIWRFSRKITWCLSKHLECWLFSEWQQRNQ